MKTEYQYIHFVKIADKPKTSIWACMNTKSNWTLGKVRWHPTWRQYCYFPNALDQVYSAGCLADIQDFIGQLKPTKG